MAAVPAPPLGQGVFTNTLVPAPVLRVSAVALTAAEWGERTEVIEGDSSRPCGNTTSLPTYDHEVAAAPPESPVHPATAPAQVLELLPYGATDLRVAVFPTVDKVGKVV